MTLEERGGWGKLSHLAPVFAEAPPPQSSPASGRGSSPSLPEYRVKCFRTRFPPANSAIVRSSLVPLCATLNPEKAALHPRFRGDKLRWNGDNSPELGRENFAFGEIVRDRVTRIRIVDCCDRRLRRANACARPRAMVERARACRFRGMRRRRGEGGDQGSQDIPAFRMPFEIRRAAQARRRLHLFRFMQNRNFDIAGPNPTPEEQKQI